MVSEPTCEECGTAIPAEAARGFCPQCLLSLGLQPKATRTVRRVEDQGATTPRLFAGTKLRYFGDYELLEEIARGGMGIVFKARQMSLNRLVALKVISSGAVATEELVKRFKAEAEAAASLSHPNIVPIHEIGEHEGEHYFSMALIEGLNLRQALAQNRNRKFEPRKRFALSDTGGYEPEKAARLLVVIARAVHYAHQRGVLHRDIKPSNILLDSAGEPHLSDFGLAKLIEKESTLTHTNAIMGTPAYMSPEQARGQAKEVTTAADVYGIGAVLYEALVGAPPFAGGTSLETIRQVLDEEPRHPSLENPKVDRDLGTICVKCLEKEPGRRYGSAESLADDLDRWLRHEPILARRTNLFARAAKWSQREPILAVAVGLLQIVFALGLAGILWQWRQAVLARRSEAAERRRAVRAESDAFTRLNESKLSYARANRLTLRPGQRFDTLTELAALAVYTNRLDARKEAIACLVLPDLRLVKEWTKTRQWSSFRFNASFHRYATNDAAGNLTVRDTETDAILARIPVRGGRPLASWAVFSQDDRFIATIDHAGQGRVWDCGTHALRRIDLPRGSTLMAFAPDTSALVVRYRDGSLHFLNPTNGVDEKAFSGPGSLAWNEFQFDSSGEKFLTRHNEEVTIWRTSDGEHLMTIRLPEGSKSRFEAAVWHPDGHRVACSWMNHIALWDIETGRQCGAFEGHESMVIGLVFTRRGQYVASASWDCTTRLWDVDTHREVLILPESGNELALSTDDRWLSFQTWHDEEVKLYELADLTAGQRITLPPPVRHRVHFTAQAVFSPDGELVGAPDAEGIYLYRASDPAPAALLAVAGTFSVSFAPDGNALFTGGTNGVQRWPLKSAARRSELHMGPPEVLDPTRGLSMSWVDLSSDGQWLVAQARNSVIALRVTPPFECVQLDQSLRLVRHPRISPEGHWVTTVPPSLNCIQVWNGRTGKLVTNLPSSGAWQCAFSPDGRWMACSQTDSTSVWNTEDWGLRRRMAHAPRDVAHGLAFSPDSHILAIFASDWEIRLLKFETGEELATFPAGRTTTAVGFHPSGDRLAVANEAGYLQLWDLRRVRDQLASVYLDWDMPPYPPPEPAPVGSRFRLIVHAGDSADLRLSREK